MVIEVLIIEDSLYMNLGLERFEVQFFQIWTWVWLISSQTCLKFRLFGGVRVGLKFGFGGRTWVLVSLNFDLSSSKRFEVSCLMSISDTLSQENLLKTSMYI